MDTPVAMITGASRGIGRAVAVTLGGAGYRLSLVGRTHAGLLETAGLAVGPGNVATVADVTDPSQVQRAIEDTVRQFGRLDAVVNVAGVAPVRSIAEMSVAEWRGVIDTNLSAIFYTMKFAWPHLKRAAAETGRAAIVNVSSLAARDPFAGFAAYGAAKAGLNLFGLAAAREGAADRIDVHTVAPGAVETAMFRAIATVEQWAPEKTLAPAEVAGVICDCVTGRLRYTSGEVIYLHKTVP